MFHSTSVYEKASISFEIIYTNMSFVVTSGGGGWIGEELWKGGNCDLSVLLEGFFFFQQEHKQYVVIFILQNIYVNLIMEIVEQK